MAPVREASAPQYRRILIETLINTVSLSNVADRPDKLNAKIVYTNEREREREGHELAYFEDRNIEIYTRRCKRKYLIPVNYMYVIESRLWKDRET